MTFTETLEDNLGVEKLGAEYWTVLDTDKYVIVDSWDTGFGVVSCATLVELRKKLAEDMLEMLKSGDYQAHWAISAYDMDGNYIDFYPTKVTVRLKK